MSRRRASLRPKSGAMLAEDERARAELQRTCGHEHIASGTPVEEKVYGTHYQVMCVLCGCTFKSIWYGSRGRPTSEAPRARWTSLIFDPERSSANTDGYTSPCIRARALRAAGYTANQMYAIAEAGGHRASWPVPTGTMDPRH